jgi:hypothetical protein
MLPLEVERPLCDVRETASQAQQQLSSHALANPRLL